MQGDWGQGQRHRGGRRLGARAGSQERDEVPRRGLGIRGWGGGLKATGTRGKGVVLGSIRVSHWLLGRALGVSKDPDREVFDV